MMCNVGVMGYFDILYRNLSGKAEGYHRKNFTISEALQLCPEQKLCVTAWPYPFIGSSPLPHQYCPRILTQNHAFTTLYSR